MSLKNVNPVQGKVDKTTDTYFSFKWSIENFCFCSKRIYKSPSFSTGDGYFVSHWYLVLETGSEIYMSQYGSYKKKYPTLKLCLQDSYDNEIRIKTWSSMTLDEKVLASFDTGSLKCRIGKENDISADNSVIYRQVEPGTLNIEVQIVLDQHSTKSSRVDDQLIEDLTHLWQSEEHSDLKIISDGNELGVHKSILSVRCPKFFDMIEKKIIKKGAVNHEVEITDVEVGTLVSFLKFLYTGYLEDIDDKPYDLVDLAIEYDVPSLRDRCFQGLQRSMEVCNVLEILVLADKHQNYNLKASALKMITDHFAEIKKKQDIDEFEKKYPQLLKEIIVLSKII